MADCDVCQHPIMDTAWVCTTCSTRLARTLAEAAELWPELDVTITRQDRMGEPGPRPRGRAPAAPIRPDGGQLRHYADQDVGWPAGLPVDLAASETAAVVRNTVTTWARVVEGEHYGDHPPYGPLCLKCSHSSCERIYEWRRRMPPPVEPGALLRWLAAELEWARHQPWAAEAWGELSGVRRLLVATIDVPMERVDAGTCLAATMDGPCQQRLTARPSATHIRCPGCGADHDARERRELLLVAARDIRGTAAEVARWLTALEIPTTAAVVRGLTHRHRVLADRLGRVRLGDVEEVRVEQLATRERMAA